MEGYTLKSQFLSESLDNPAQSIYIDRNKKIEIITKELTERGSLRLEKDYTFDEVITQLNKKITIFINISFFDILFLLTTCA
jgi:antitoxin component YwqK of YwqJK toxin-antitoxin module